MHEALQGAEGPQLALVRHKGMVHFGGHEPTFAGRLEGERLTLCGHLQPNDGSTVDLSCSIHSFRDDTKFHQMCCARLAWCRFAAQRGIRPDFASRWG